MLERAIPILLGINRILSYTEHMPYHVVIIGAGASGLMCARIAGLRGLRVLLLDHRKRFGQKLIISGGGRCNVTNLDMRADAFLCANPHFVKSAIARFTPADCTDFLASHRIAYAREDKSQLFLKSSPQRLHDVLVGEAKRTGGEFVCGRIQRISKKKYFELEGSFGKVEAEKLVVATGGLSYATLGASDFGYRVAKQFGHALVPTRPGLVPLKLSRADLGRFQALSGISFPIRVRVGKRSIEDDCLITHRGLSGPAILSISSFWREAEPLVLDLLPGIDIVSALEEARSRHSKKELRTLLSKYLPDRLARLLCETSVPSRPVQNYTAKEVRAIAHALHTAHIVPSGTEGYAKAEVTVGGVDTDGLSSKTMESRHCAGLYFIGEVVDVTGDLGGYNLHWAWASGVAAGRAL